MALFILSRCHAMLLLLFLEKGDEKKRRERRAEMGRKLISSGLLLGSFLFLVMAQRTSTGKRKQLTFFLFYFALLLDGWAA